MYPSTILIIVIIVVCILIGICSVICHFVEDGGRSFDESPAPVLHPRALGGKSCSCHEEFQGTCKDCLFVVHNGHGLNPEVGVGDKGFGGDLDASSPTSDPFRSFLGNNSNSASAPPASSDISESTALTSVNVSDSMFQS